MFAWQNAIRGSLELPGLKLLPLPSSPHRVAKFDLTLSLQETGDSIAGADRVRRPRCSSRLPSNAIWDTFRNLLEAWSPTTPRQSIGCAYCPPRSVIGCCTSGTTPRPSIRRTSVSTSCSKSRSSEDPGSGRSGLRREQLSYGELNRRANQLAHYLRELGVKPDDRVAICAGAQPGDDRRLLAVLKAGGAYVPLDPDYPPETAALHAGRQPAGGPAHAEPSSESCSTNRGCTACAGSGCRHHSLAASSRRATPIQPPSA